MKPLKIRSWMWRLFLRSARAAVWRADEWVHAQEIRMQEAGNTNQEAVPAPIEFDRKASAARECIRRREMKVKMPRLRYQAGQWVRQ